MRYCGLRFAGALVLAAGSTLGGMACAAEPAGTVVLAVGNVTDQAADGNRRTLHDGDQIYSGDSLSTGRGAYLDLDFADGGRILLRPGTRFQIEHYRYAAAAPVQTAAPATARSEVHESAFFRLIKGGLRAISGLIGHVTRADYRLDTPVATIGIRGTGYEVRYCASHCPRGEKGLYTGVGTGAIAIRNQAGERIATAGHFGYLASRTARFRRLRHAPRALRHMRLPSRYRARDVRNFRRVQLRRRRRWQHIARERALRRFYPHRPRVQPRRRPPYAFAQKRRRSGNALRAPGSVRRIQRHPRALLKRKKKLIHHHYRRHR